MLLLKYNDNYDLFDEDERSEFIFRIFQHVTLGGDTEQVCDKSVQLINMYHDIMFIFNYLSVVYSCVFYEFPPN